MGFLEERGQWNEFVEACPLLQLHLPLSALAPSIRSLSRQGAGWGGIPPPGASWLDPKAPLPQQDEKEQLNEYKGHLSGLAKRAKAIVQLKPRNPAHPVRGHVPLLAVCDYKQVEVRAEPGWAQARGAVLTRT